MADCDILRGHVRMFGFMLAGYRSHAHLSMVTPVTQEKAKRHSEVCTRISIETEDNA